ncbi:MAG: hypothetical protein RR288_00770, partial [Oscillibacter sp.]
MGLFNHIKSLLGKFTLLAHLRVQAFYAVKPCACRALPDKLYQIERVPGLPLGGLGNGFAVVDVGNNREVANMGL